MIARWAHLASSVVLVGASVSLLLAGRSDRPTARRWAERMLGWSRWLVVVALVSGLGILAAQVVLVEGRADAALDPSALGRLLLETQAGVVWLARHGLLVLLALFLALRPDTERSADWQAARGETALLAGAGLGLLSLGGHAAAVEPGLARAVVADIVHLVAAGVWIGGLLPLAALLRAASDEAGADARPYAVLAARRFSRAALAAVAVLVVSGVANAATQVGGVAALVGTAYGRLLLAKLSLLVAIVALGALNRRRLLPALPGDAGAVGRPAMRRLAGVVVAEGALGLLVLGVVAWMTVTPPARHAEPTWPFAFRLAGDALVTPGARTRVLAGSQMAILGGVGVLAALALRRGRTPTLAGALVLLGAAAALALPPLAVDAYPTTYRRPAVAYHATSIANGAALFAEHCARCHGPGGAGDGREGRGLPRPPADLRAQHTAAHTAGDLFWWITHGIPSSGMPAFGERLTEDERWDLVNVLRALSAAWWARPLGPSVEPGRAWVVAPDFAFSVGPTPPRRLSDYRGRRIVLLVLYTLPGSRPRLAQLGQSYDVLVTLGVEVVAVPTDAAPDAIKRLGAEPRILFPVATDGAPEILETYRLLALPVRAGDRTAPHAELLIDRQGYVRARWTTAGATGREMNLLLAEVQELNAEKAPAPPPAEHVH